MKQVPRVNKPRGLGDVVETVAKVTGIKSAVEAVGRATGNDCGCARRRDRLNELVPFRKDPDGLQSDAPRAQ